MVETIGIDKHDVLIVGHEGFVYLTEVGSKTEVGCVLGADPTTCTAVTAEVNWERDTTVLLQTVTPCEFRFALYVANDTTEFSLPELDLEEKQREFAVTCFGDECKNSLDDLFAFAFETQALEGGVDITEFVFQLLDCNDMLLRDAKQVTNDGKGTYSFSDRFEVITSAGEPDTAYLLDIIGHRHELDVTGLQVGFGRNKGVEVLIEEIVDCDTIFTNDRLVVEVFSEDIGSIAY